MKSYPQRVSNNLLPLSIAGNLPEAFTEWQFTEEIHDHESAEEICELCDKEQLRYHFRIVNTLNENKLWVGSTCILRFDIAVLGDDGIVLDNVNAKKKLNKLTEKMHQDYCFKALEAIVQKESHPALQNALDYYKANKFFTPKYAAMVLWRLDSNNIPHNASFFKIRINKDQWKEDLKKLKPIQFKTIYKSLTDSQRKLAVKLGQREYWK